MTEHTAQLVWSRLGTLLESPRWCPASGLLSWVDIPTGTLFFAAPDAQAPTRVATGLGPLGAALPREGGGWELVAAPASYRAEGEGLPREPLTPLMSSERDPLISNDAARDPWGRLYVGRMDPDETAGRGELRVYDAAGSRRVAGELTIPNGLAWNRDGSSMFFAESALGRVFRVPTGPEGERWSERSVFVELAKDDGVPDGLCVDDLGRLWLACYGAGEVRCYAESGALLSRHRLPVAQVTSCVAVGDDLFVTTAAEGFTAADWAAEPLAGSVFRLPGVLGAERRARSEARA